MSEEVEIRVTLPSRAAEWLKAVSERSGNSIDEIVALRPRSLFTSGSEVVSPTTPGG